MAKTPPPTLVKVKPVQNTQKKVTHVEPGGNTRKPVSKAGLVR